MVRYTLKILQRFLQDLQSVSELFGTLSVKVLYALTSRLALTVCSSPQNVRTQGWNDFDTCN